MKTGLITRLFLGCMLLLPATFMAQDALRSYITEGLNSNIVLKEKQIGLDKSLVALKAAKSLFLPSTHFETVYNVAGGGRSIDIPVGDLLNPVYQTLNNLTSSEKFPAIGNSSEKLLPNNFYDARIKTTMPLINPEIRINRNIKHQQVQLQEYEIDVYKRELVKEIRLAYYNYLMATEAINIYESALVVVTQNVRLNQSLLTNGKGLPAYVARAESEAKSVESKLQTAKNEQKNAQAYFNFLLNQSLNRPIVTDNSIQPDSLFNTLLKTETNTSNREELKSLKVAADINENILKMNRSFRTPKLNAFVDLGSQGFDFKVNDKSFFYLAGLQVTFPIFDGKRNQYKIEETQLDGKSLWLQTEQTKQQLQLAAHVSRNNAASAYSNYQASQQQLEAARQYFKLVDRGYKEGVNSFIEFLDARNQLTGSQMQVAITKYKLAGAMAEYERQVGTYIINL